MKNTSKGNSMIDFPELTERQLKTAIQFKVRKRLIEGALESGEDISSLRKFVGLSQEKFSEAMGISVHTLRNWEQGRRKPDGSAISLLRIAARHPKILKENLAKAA
jgi:putative transcriptional regulator